MMQARDLAKLERTLTIDATMGPVCSPPLLLGLVDLNVLDVQVLCLQALDLDHACCLWPLIKAPGKHALML